EGLGVSRSTGGSMKIETAIMTLARQGAKRAVLAQLRAQGLRLGEFSAREIALKTDDYFAANIEPLINEAVEVITTSPHFARWRCAKLTTDAQEPKALFAKAFAVQNSCSKWRANQ